MLMETSMQGASSGRVKSTAASKEGVPPVRVELEERKPAKRSHKKGASRGGQDQARPRQANAPPPFTPPPQTLILYLSLSLH